MGEAEGCEVYADILHMFSKGILRGSDMGLNFNSYVDNYLELLNPCRHYDVQEIINLNGIIKYF